MRQIRCWFAVVGVLATVGCKWVPHQNFYCDNMQWKCLDSSKPYCDLSQNLCVPTPIDMSTDMDGGSDLGGCAGMSSACPAAMPICDTTGACRTCSGPSDDGACMMRNSSLPRCGSSGTCVECRTSTDCKDAAKPVCGSDGSCRACIATNECPSSVCILTGSSAGQCANASQVAWVDNTNAACSTGNGSAPTAPTCEIDKAIMNWGTSRPYVRVAGSATPYAAVTQLQATATNIGPLQISGPGITASPTARVFTVAADAFPISAPNGVTVSVALEGLEIGGTGGGMVGAYGVNVSTSGSGMVTVLVSGCFIHNSNSGGMNLTGTTNYTIVNNIIGGNGSGAGTNAGVVIANASSGTFAFNTVAANTVASGPSGVDCTSTSKMIVASIVTDNFSAGGGPQLGTSCSLSNVVQSGVDFVGTSDWHLKADANNAACCIDKITSDPGTPLKNVDVNGTIRPKGAGWDIGAHEVQ